MLYKMKQTLNYTVWIYLVISTIVSCDAKKKKLVVNIERMNNCPGFENAVAHLSDFSFPYYGAAGQLLNAKVTVGEVAPKIQATVDASKCKTLEDHNCEHFIRTKHDLCKLLVDKNQFYTPLFEAVHPRVTCPVKEGEYKLINGSISAPEVLAIVGSLPDALTSHWKLKVKMFEDPKNPYLCVVLIFNIIEFHKH